MKNTKAILGLSATYLTWSLYGVLIAASKYGTGSVTIQAVFSFIAFFAYAKYKNIKLSFKEALGSIFYSIVRVASLVLMVLCYQFIDVGMVNTIGACGVFIMAGFFAPLAGEKFNSKIILPCLVSILGVGIASGAITSSGINNVSIGYLLAVAGMIVATYSIILWRKSVLKISTTKHIVYMHGWTALFSAPVVLVMANSGLISNHLKPSVWQLAIVIIASVSGALGDVIYSLTQKISNVTINGLFVPSGAVFSCLLGWAIIGEKLTFAQSVGISLIVLSVGVANYFISKEDGDANVVEEVFETTNPTPNVAVA